MFDEVTSGVCKRLRQRAGLTQKELAPILGISRMTMSRVECGKARLDGEQEEKLMDHPPARSASRLKSMVRRFILDVSKSVTDKHAPAFGSFRAPWRGWLQVARHFASSSRRRNLSRWPTSPEAMFVVPGMNDRDEGTFFWVECNTTFHSDSKRKLVGAFVRHNSLSSGRPSNGYD